MAKRDFLYKSETPIVYKLWKGMMVDSSTVKENLIRIDPTNGNTIDSLNRNIDLYFKIEDSNAFLQFKFFSIRISCECEIQNPT